MPISGGRLRPWIALLLLLPLGVLARGENTTRQSTPKLAVLVYFDQLRGDYLSRWEKLFGEGGFRRLMKDGAWFQNCHYPYAYTVTAAGHASVATGTSPYQHGIVGNDWYERDTGPSVNCVSS